MSTEKEETSWGSVAVLLVAGIVVLGLVWRSYQRDAPPITAYQAPSAPSAAGAPQIETGTIPGRRGREPFQRAPLRRGDLGLPEDARPRSERRRRLYRHGAGPPLQRKPDEAVAALKKATALDPKQQRIWLSYGFVLKSLGRQKPARAALEKTVALDPASAQGIEAKSMLKR